MRGLGIDLEFWKSVMMSKGIRILTYLQRYMSHQIWRMIKFMMLQEHAAMVSSQHYLTTIAKVELQYGDPQNHHPMCSLIGIQMMNIPSNQLPEDAMASRNYLYSIQGTKMKEI